MDDHSVLGASIRSGLADRSVDRRKQASEALERQVRDLAQELEAAGRGPGDQRVAHDKVAKILRCLVDEFCASAFPERRKVGLRGLAAAAIALEPRNAQVHVAQLVPAVLTCFSDEDPGVRYSACEAFYNIAKVVRGALLGQPNSGENSLGHLRYIFDGLCRLYSDVDQSVKDGALCLDRLVRDIVTECRDFDYPAFIPLLTTRIRVLNPSVRQLVLGWILLLDSVPQVDMIEYLPQYLEGLFGILTSENREIRSTAEGCLIELLTEIKSRAAEKPLRAQRAVADAAPTVAKCCRGGGERRPEDNYMRLRALHWLLEFVRLQLELELSPHMSEEAPGMRAAGVFQFRHVRASSAGGSSSTVTTPVADPSRGGATPSTAAAPAGGEAPGGGLRTLVPVLLSGALHCLDDVEDEIRQNAEQANAALRQAAACLERRLPVEAVADAVLGAMQCGDDGQERSPAVLLKCFGWARLLLRQAPSRVLQPPVRDRLLEAALSVLGCPEEEARDDGERSRPTKDPAESARREAVAAAALQLVASLVAPCEGVPAEEAPAAPDPNQSIGPLSPSLPTISSTGDGLHDAEGAVGGDVADQAGYGSQSLGAAPDGAASSLPPDPSCDAEAAELLLAQRPDAQPASSAVASGGAAHEPREPTGAAAEPAAERERSGSADVADPETSLFARMCRRLFELMKEDRRVLSVRGELIVRQLCEGVDADRFYTIAARAVVAEKDHDFAQHLVRVLNWVLLTSRETRALRARLRTAAAKAAVAAGAPRPSLLQALGVSEGARQEPPALPGLLLDLLRSWMRCPVSTLALCMWLHWFELAAEVTTRLASADPTPGLRTQLTELAELLESPVFARVRLELLDTQKRPELLRTVLGLVSLLPQEKTLRKRLDVVTTGILLDRLRAPPALHPREQSAAVAAHLATFDSLAGVHGWHACVM